MRGSATGASHAVICPFLLGEKALTKSSPGCNPGLFALGHPHPNPSAGG